MTLEYRCFPTGGKLPKTYKYFYATEGTDYWKGHEEVPEDERHSIKSTWNKDTPRYVVEDVAEHFFDDGGWENTWPLTFKLWDEEGIYLGEYEVELEYTPHFYATKVKVP